MANNTIRFIPLQTYDPSKRDYTFTMSLNQAELEKLESLIEYMRSKSKQELIRYLIMQAQIPVDTTLDR